MQCEARNIEVIAPCNENSFTAEKRAQAGENGPIRKDEFTWIRRFLATVAPKGIR